MESKCSRSAEHTIAADEVAVSIALPSLRAVRSDIMLLRGK
jgi:hypothetical protein